MKLLPLLFAGMTIPLAAQTLPEAKLQPFSSVPAAIPTIKGPLKPMEAIAPDLKDCANAPALFQKLGIALTEEQRLWLEKNRFILIPVESTKLGEEPPADADAEEWAYTSDEMLSAFSQISWNMIEYRSPDETNLVTPDLLLHAWYR